MAARSELINAGRFIVSVTITVGPATAPMTGTIGSVRVVSTVAGPEIFTPPGSGARKWRSWPEGATRLELTAFDRAAHALLSAAGVSEQYLSHPDLWGIEPGAARDDAKDRLLQRRPDLNTFPRNLYM